MTEGTYFPPEVVASKAVDDGMYLVRRANFITNEFTETFLHYLIILSG